MLIVHGDPDVQAPLAICGEPTARLDAGSTFLVYENAAHGLFVTHAGRLNADLLAFAEQHGTSTACTNPPTAIAT